MSFYKLFALYNIGYSNVFPFKILLNKLILAVITKAAPHISGENNLTIKIAE